jgi:hypothetical protein
VTPPLVLLPFRLETRFGQGAAGPELWVRIYPSQISIDGHDPRLSPDELDAGKRYWAGVWEASTLEEEKTPWRALADAFGPQRAAYVAQKLTPSNYTPGVRPGPAPGPDFPTGLATRASSFEQPSVAELLPGRWTVVTYRGTTETHRVESLPVQAPLAVGPTPHSTAVLDPASGLSVDDGMRWLVDFEAAVQAGMGVRITDLSADEQRRGFDKVVAYGLPAPSAVHGPLTHVWPQPPPNQSQALAALFEAHRFTDGLAFLPQGSPTNNTPEARSAYSSGDTGYDAALAAERGAALDLEDGRLAAEALGIPAETFEHTAHADRHDQEASHQMKVALWPGTLGYFLSQMMSPVLDSEQVEAARSWFLRNVSPRGALPAFRVGSTPYGILPAISLENLTPPRKGIASGLHTFLTRVRETWLDSSSGIPRVGGSDTPGDDLVGILGMDASASGYQLRYGFGPEVMNGFTAFFNLPGGKSQVDRLSAATWQLLQRYGYDNLSPRLLGFGLAEDSARVGSPTVTAEPLSETARLTDDYLTWLATASLADVEAEAYPGGTPPSALLYRLLRHSLITQAADTTMELLLVADEVEPTQLAEAEIVDVKAERGTTLTRGRSLHREVEGVTEPGQTAMAYIDSMAQLDATPYSRLDEMRASLKALAALPTAELDLLVTETLDAFSHRIDAWATSFANERLLAERSDGAASTLVGGYAWLEHVRPGPGRSSIGGEEADAIARLDAEHAEATGGPASRGEVQEPHTDNGGFIHAPSIVQAEAGAVLRCGYLSHRNEPDETQLAVNLTSGRVNRALQLIDGVRQGQPLGALLGYRVESALHSGGLDRYIQPLRDAYPIVANKLTQPPVATESAGASNVVDGLALQRAWAAGTVSVNGGVPSGVEEVLDALTDDLDALGDLSIAEGVYQAMRGNYARGGGLLDALSRGDHPPEPEVVRTDPTGRDVTHRIASLLVGDPATPGAGVRAQAEPQLDAWVGSQLPDPADVRCTASYVRPNGTIRETVVRLDKLDLDPLDLLALADGADVGAGSELEQRIAYEARRVWGVDPSEVTLDFERDGSWSSGEVSFGELLLVARALGDLVGGARPLRSTDLFEPGRVDSAEQEDLTARADAATAALDAAVTALGAATTAAARRAALLDAAALGAMGSIPASRFRADADARAALEAQADSVLAELSKRQAAATAAGDPVEQIQAVLGESFVVLPRFRFGTAADGTELDTALGGTAQLLGTDVDAPARWFQQLTHVRPAVSRIDAADALAALVTGVEQPDFQIAQWPPLGQGPDRWLALAPQPGDPPQPSGRVALAARLSDIFDAAEWLSGLLLDEWVERVPDPVQTTGVTFHYDEPGSRAPQALLLAVCPDQRPAWDDDLVLATINETLDLAKIRSVDLEGLNDFGQILPALWFAFNPDGQTVSFDTEVIWL